MNVRPIPMPPFLLTYAPFAAVTAVAIVLFVVIGAKLGMGFGLIANILLGALALGLAALVYKLGQQLGKRDIEGRGARLLAERLQAMLAVIPGGYCLFTTQGLLREVLRVPQILGVEKIAHLDDIIGALSETQNFVESFRSLQQTGTGFITTARVNKTGTTISIKGSRFRVGREGPAVDLLWFNAQTAAATEAPAAKKATDTTSMKAMLDALPFPAWIRQNTLQISLVNEAYAKVLDTTTDKALSEQIELVSQPSPRGGGSRMIAGQALTTQQAQTARRHVIVTGNRRLMEITEQPHHNADNTPMLFGFALDVTSEEEKENELARHKASENEVLENLGSAIAIYGPDMRLEFFNRAYQRLWGAEETFLSSKPTFGEILEDLRARRRAPEQADFQRYKKERVALFTSLLEPREDLMHLPDGTTLRILAIPHPMGGLMFVHEDVTDKLALESSYNTLIAVQRETLDNLTEGIAVFGPDGKIQLFNPAFARIWNLKPDHLNTNPHIAELLEHMKPLFNYGNNWSEFKGKIVQHALDRAQRRDRLTRADGTMIETLSVPLPDGAMLVSHLDVTDSIKVEQALRLSNAALAEADRLKSEFVANVSYQLRTPLNTIMGFAEILTNQYFGTLNERQAEYTRTIMDASKKLLLLINDVLDLATIEAGRMTLERRNLSTADLLNAVKMMSTEWARQQSLTIMIDCPTEVGNFVADEQRMKQVLFNLITNSIKYTPPGGRITLEARREDEAMAITVADTGIGIPEEDKERVFGKFERSNAEARQGGAGLGLALVKSFVELHGGTINVETARDKGTRITCRIPLSA